MNRRYFMKLIMGSIVGISLPGMNPEKHFGVDIASGRDLFAFELFQKVNFLLLGTVLYIDGKSVGLVIELRSESSDVILIKVNPFVDEFRYVIDSTKPEAKLMQWKVYETTESKKNWMVNEIYTLDSFRYFRIQVNSKIS